MIVSYKDLREENNFFNNNFWPTKNHTSTELLEQTKLFSLNKNKIYDSKNCVFLSHYNKLDFKKTQKYAEFNEKIFETNSHIKSKIYS